MGGRGQNLSKQSGINLDYEKHSDIWTYRHQKQNERFVDNVNQTIREMGETYNELNSVINDVYIAKTKGRGAKSVMAFWNSAGELGINKNFGNIDKMASAYEKEVKSGFTLATVLKQQSRQ